jgi:hypothetical protein
MIPQLALVQPLRRWDPEQINGYVLIGRLGAGAMGRVYLGRSAAGRLVAVKTIKIELADEPDFRTRFAQEVAAARRVSGAFTAAVIAADPEADLPWLATVYVPAPSLSRLVRAVGPLPAQAVRWLGAGCAEALESIHSAGLVHRDLKPSNVLVSPDGPRVIDFGIARAAERIQLTVARGAVGTPAYMAPEQARDTRQATMASDVFSLGATMVFAATGHPPYQGQTVMDVLVKLATEPPDLSGLPYELAGVVSACLERNPRKRPTPAAVLAHLAPSISATDGRELGPSSLPDSALALIGEYRRDPQPASQPGEYSDEDETFGSHAGLSLPGQAAAGRAHRAPSHRMGRRAAGGGPLGGPAQREPGRRPARWILAAAAAAALLAGTATAVFAAADNGHKSPAQSGTLPRSGTKARPSTQARPSPTTAPPGRRQGMHLYQSTGDSQTIFLMRGGGWPPGVPLTVTLAGTVKGTSRTSPEHPSADRAGNFSYAINQDGKLFPGGLPAGGYTVQLSGPDGSVASASFTVSRATRPAGSTPNGGLSQQVSMNQRTGDGRTTFVVMGSGWRTGRPVTVTITGPGISRVSPEHPITDSSGNFSYAINQEGELLSGRPPPGSYRVTVSVPGGSPATTSFSVNPPLPGQPPGGPPPPGQP